MGRNTAVGDDDLFQMMSPNSLEKVNAECQGGDALDLDPGSMGFDTELAGSKWSTIETVRLTDWLSEEIPTGHDVHVRMNFGYLLDWNLRLDSDVEEFCFCITLWWTNIAMESGHL